ncbi:unnamed protein product (macronuclear) [Paramecium tetraurelia]|uniref:Casein kinase I n=1 Tax=Paramecium tetraurelia TaxID=5888 RepID=A0BQN6_PARTE|nr:uncharacterized protein GSPATT00031082001 [Paramecium tetraurelia]CAK60853.1 unnamed protein product [Paramecium tetraurelia]|eukprot:XP_001428251.1 hypothetical protein (macronuclear) [Paramecium tetraurelia strain d4-2]
MSKLIYRRYLECLVLNNIQFFPIQDVDQSTSCIKLSLVKILNYMQQQLKNLHQLANQRMRQTCCKNQVELKEFHKQSSGLTNDNKRFLIEPLLPSSLLDLAKSRTLSLPLIMTIGLRVIEILEQVHKNNILHLDIKPENIMLSYLISNDQYSQSLD